MKFKNIFCYLALSAPFLSTQAFADAREDVAYRGTTVYNAQFTSRTNSGKVVYAAPGEKIRGEAQVKSPAHPQVVVGLAGIEVQSGISGAPFFLRAPQEPGIYEICFSTANTDRGQHNADLRMWSNPAFSPPPEATLGLIIVCSNPELSPRELDDTNWVEWLNETHSN
jgi:hypothetical protein